VVEEVGAIAGACGSHIALYGALELAAFRGREAEASRVIEAASKDFRAAGEGMGLTVVEWATAMLYNGLARYEDALVAAQQASEDPNELWFSAWALAELVEAASRTGHRERGAHALRRLTEVTRASGTEWALGIEARSRALLCNDHARDVRGRLGVAHEHEQAPRCTRSRGAAATVYPATLPAARNTTPLIDSLPMWWAVAYHRSGAR
jgi:hypothetical protein